MNSQEQIEVTPRRTFLQNLPKTRLGKFLLTASFIGLCFVAALAIWRGRELFALVIIAILVLYGIRAITDALPLSSKTREWMAEDARLSELYPSYRYKFFLWLGIGFLIPKIWHFYQGKAISGEDLIVPLALIVCGLVATIIWHFRHSKNERGA
jgi:hypothetical protein